MIKIDFNIIFYIIIVRIASFWWIHRAIIRNG